MRSKSSSGSRSSGCGRWPMPALLMSSARNARTRHRISFTSSARLTSTRSHRAPVASATRFAAASSRSAISTFAPSATNFLTMPSPKPEPPPVTMAALPCSRMGCSLQKRTEGDYRAARRRRQAASGAAPRGEPRWPAARGPLLTFDVCCAGLGWRGKGTQGEQNHRWTSRQVLPAGGDFCGDEKRSARVGARERASWSDLPRLFERSDRRERSEFCGTTLARASQWSRRTAPTATA
jgi:hypothetical protein